MKKLLLGTLLVAVSSAALAEAPGGPNCGWGNMLFKGQRGTASHFVASTTNGTLTYGGKPMLIVSNMMDELSEDMAKGQGEALTTYAVVLGVAPQDRAHFNEAAHAHFNEIFSSASVSAADVHAATLAMMQKDARLAKYAHEA